MKMSPFFSELSSSYAYEIEDLTWDSAGDNVLASRLKVKRDQFADLLPMSEFDPVMVAPAFRGAFRFNSPEAMARLIAGQPDDFPEWAEVESTLELEPWARKLAQRALASPGGEQFMLIAAGLEYIQSGPGPATATVEAAASPGGETDEDDEEHEDLAEAGEDYLSEQGFDRRS
ncbi:MAG: hypothetical protein JSS40_04500 [Proteobacteria bacterium]|nr:hypothetical protein [Pseudomonadota bacterium]